MEKDKVINKLLVHIGYHKTGTTWLQRNVFQNESLGFRVGLSKEDIYRLLVLPRALVFDANYCRSEFARIIESGRIDMLSPVVSSEELCASPHSGAHMEKELAERLAATLPDARVLIVIREQRAMLASSYKQYVRAGASHSLDIYLNPPSLGDTRASLPDWRHFRYDALIRCYRELFGAKHVLVLPYELFQSNPQEFVGRISQFCGKRPDPEYVEALPFQDIYHPSLKAYGTGIKRRLNRYFSQTNRMNPSPWVALSGRQHDVLFRLIQIFEGTLPDALTRRAENRMHSKINEWAQGRFKRSNAVTNQWTEYDLRGLGYEI